jgi:hypothetical protein
VDVESSCRRAGRGCKYERNDGCARRDDWKSS